MIIKMGPVMGKKPAIVGTIEVNQGQHVQAGQVLVQVETGKGNRPVKAALAGTILKILCSEGEAVTSGQSLFEFEEELEAAGQDCTLETDLFILGGGPGGYVAALYAAKLGMKVVLAEKNLIGGTCLNRGCVPTKTFIQSAHLYQQMKNSAAFGVVCKDITVDSEAVFARKEQICTELRTGIEMLLYSSNVTVLNGEAAYLEFCQYGGCRRCQVRIGSSDSLQYGNCRRRHET